MSRKTIDLSPLEETPFDTLISGSQESSNEKIKITKAPIIENQSKQPIKPKAKKQRLTIQISEDIIERAKNAVYWTRGLTLAQLTEEALEKAIKSLEKNSTIYDDKTGLPLKEKGDEFPKRKENLKSGRPVN